MELKSGYPFWLIKDGLPYDYPKLEDCVKCEVAIIGAGISGALTAYYLTQAGFSCVLVDRRSVGLGSTCASTSLLQYELDKPLSELSKTIGIEAAENSYRLCSYAVDKIGEICKSIRHVGYTKRSSLFYAAFKKDVSLVEKEYEFRKNAGFKVKLLNENDIYNSYGFMAPAAILSQKGACVDAYKLTHALLQYSIKKGLRVYDRSGVSGINYKTNGAELILENGSIIYTKKIVNATGYEVQSFLSKKVYKLHSTYAVISEQLNNTEDYWKDQALIWNTANPYLYIRSTADKRIIIGGRDEIFYNPVKRDQLLKLKTKQLTNDFKKLFPEIGFIPEFSWTGSFGVTKDSLPYIGVNEEPYTYYALGFGGNGITFSLIAAEIITDLISGKKNRYSNLFSFDR